MRSALRTVRRCCLVLFFVAASSRAGWVEAHGVTLDIYHPLPADSVFHTAFLVNWAQKVEKESGGRLHFHLHPAADVTASNAGLYEQLVEGQADIVWTPIKSSVDHLPRLAPFEFPFTVNHAQGASRALAEYVRVNDLAERDFDGVRLLAVHVSDGSQLHLRSATQSPPTDNTQLRVAVFTPVDAELVSAMGWTPMESQPAQCVEALNAGSIDGVLSPWERLSAPSIDRATHSHFEFGSSNIGVTTTLFVLAMSASSYRGLADDLKAVINANSGIETAAWLGRVFDEAAGAARKSAIERGDVVREFAPAEQEPWRRAGQIVTDARLKAAEQAGIRATLLQDSARKYLQEFDRSK